MENIAIIIPDLSNGGAEKVAANLSIGLTKRGKNIFFILYNSNEIDYNYEGRVIDLGCKKSNNFITKLYAFLKRYIKIKIFKRKHNIDISISFLENANLINLLTKTNDKVILTIHAIKSKSISDFYGKIYNQMIKLLYNKAEKIVTPSNGIKTDLTDNYNINNNKTIVINNLFDFEKIKLLSNKMVEPQYKNIFDSKVIISMGRLNSSKGQWHLIRAFNKVSKNFKNTKLVIMGEGELRPYLEKLINNLNLQNQVFLLGFQNNPFKFLKNSTLFVLPSLVEGFGNVLIEAMICKLPILSSNCMVGPKEILSPNINRQNNINKPIYTKYGILIPVCDGNKYSANVELTNEEEIMANTILKMLESNTLLKKYRNRMHNITEKYNMNHIIEKWIALLDSVS